MAEEEEGRRPGNRDCGETGKSGEQPVGEGSAAGGGKRKKRSDVALLSKVKTENKKLPGFSAQPRALGDAGSREWKGRPRPSRDPGVGVRLHLPGGAPGPLAPAAPAPLSVQMSLRLQAAVSFNFARFPNVEVELSAISFKTNIQPPEWLMRRGDDLAFPFFFSFK